MRFLVVGAGSVGCYVGGRLAADGNEVVFMERGPARDVLDRHGLRIESADNAFNLETPTTFVAHESAGFFDYVLICVRAAETESVIEAVRPSLSFDCAVVSLQSGIDPMYRLMDAFGARHVMPGYARVAVESLSPAVVQELDSGPIFAVGEHDNRGSWRLECLQIAFESVGFAIVKSKDVIVDQWRNFLLESTLASAAAQFDLGLEQLLKTAKHRARLSELLEEGIAIAAAESVAINESPEALLSSVEPDPDEIWLHMRRDMAAGRPIENRALAGGLTKRAHNLGLSAPGWEQLYEVLERRAPSPSPGRDSTIPPVRVR